MPTKICLLRSRVPRAAVINPVRPQQNPINISLLLIWLVVFLPSPCSTGTPLSPIQLSESREQHANTLQPPDQVMDLIGVRPGMIIGEVGAGRGRMTVHLANRVGDQGRIYANDINPSAITYLKDRCKRLGLANVEPFVSTPEHAQMPQNRLDMVFMSWVYHHVDQPVPLLRSLLPSLKPWAFLVMVEPAPAHTQKESRILTRERVEEEATAAGFRLETMLEGTLKEDNIFILRPIVPEAPEFRDRRKIRALWEVYLAWTKTSQSGTSPRDYAVSLEKAGVPAEEIQKQLQVLRRQFTEQPEGIEMIYDPLYGKTFTGDPTKDGFKTAPNSFLVEAVKALKPSGQALDVGAGMGRNAIHLAKLGWEVTGIDLSERGLAVLRADAQKAGKIVHTVKTSYEDFDFGRERWDLVAMILSWAPIEDPAFLARVKNSLRPGGHILFEHVVQRKENPFPPGVHAPSPGALREWFQDFEILVYREVDDYGDWGGPPCRHVRMVARKRS